MASPCRIVASLPIAPKSTQSSLRFASKGGFRVYRNKDGMLYRRDLVLAANKFSPKEPLTGAIQVDVTFVLKRPNAMKKGGREPAPVRPDRDNLLKPLFDSLTSSAWWVDDAQICKGETSKLYGATGEAPCIEINVSKL